MKKLIQLSSVTIFAALIGVPAIAADEVSPFARNLSEIERQNIRPVKKTTQSGSYAYAKPVYDSAPMTLIKPVKRDQSPTYVSPSKVTSSQRPAKKAITRKKTKCPFPGVKRFFERIKRR
jgi:hypothetical protein